MSAAAVRDAALPRVLAFNVVAQSSSIEVVDS